MVEIITYEALYEILRNEKFKPELQKLDQDFFKKVTKYLSEKKSILESQQKKKSIFSSTESKKSKKQLENVYKIIKEIYERRENKIIQLALFSSRAKNDVDLSVMLQEEQKFFNSILYTLNNYRKGILTNILNEKLPSIDQKEEPKELKIDKKPSTKLVKFTEAIPKFVGDDLNIYGPFEPEDMASLPLKVAQVLINKKKAQEVK